MWPVCSLTSLSPLVHKCDLLFNILIFSIKNNTDFWHHGTVCVLYYTLGFRWKARANFRELRWRIAIDSKLYFVCLINSCGLPTGVNGRCFPQRYPLAPGERRPTRENGGGGGVSVIELTGRLPGSRPELCGTKSKYTGKDWAVKLINKGLVSPEKNGDGVPIQLQIQNFFSKRREGEGVRTSGPILKFNTRKKGGGCLGL